jgi:hypothetical protein
LGYANHKKSPLGLLDNIFMFAEVFDPEELSACQPAEK